ncbi:hypothetical protein [Vibrio ouci]|uniref:Uncharacterized protein n=1 Tax=Vibrio ouci TaxID=2499078 RepID=A0A4Y8W9A8_9VIBR|nr:hypothetical protein [Vibrio ouci]TFH89374.1 hypothetical protein ELS82_22650 [Vibrio ouci]
MKRHLTCLTFFLSLGVTASEMDIASLPSCHELDEEIVNGRGGYHCADLIKESDYERYNIQETGTARSHPNYINFNGNSTEFILHNKGGYFARLILEYDWYDESTGQYYRHKKVSGAISVGNKTSFTAGWTVPYALVSAEMETLAGWKTIFTDYIYAIENKWATLDDSFNKMQWDVWGTIFNAPAKQVQPPGTYNYIESNYVVMYGNVEFVDYGLVYVTDVDQPVLPLEINDRMKAWSIPEGWTVRFYEDAHFQGNYYTRDGGYGSDPELWDKISSVEIIHRGEFPMVDE